MSIEDIMEQQEHAFTPDGETLYTADGNIYKVFYDCDHGSEITDFELVSNYSELSD